MTSVLKERSEPPKKTLFRVSPLFGRRSLFVSLAFSLAVRQRFDVVSATNRGRLYSVWRSRLPTVACELAQCLTATDRFIECYIPSPNDNLGGERKEIAKHTFNHNLINEDR